MTELNLEEIRPTNVWRIGKAGRHPRQVLATLKKVQECDQVVEKCRDKPSLKNNIFVTRDRTFKQRQEAKLFRLEKEKERDADVPQLGVGGRGRGRGRSTRGRGGRGGAGSRQRTDSDSRKRRNSEDEPSKKNDEEPKRRKTAVEVDGGGGGGNEGGGGEGSSSGTLNPQSEPEMGAVGGASTNF